MLKSVSTSPHFSPEWWTFVKVCFNLNKFNPENLATIYVYSKYKGLHYHHYADDVCNQMFVSMTKTMCQVPGYLSLVLLCCNSDLLLLGPVRILPKANRSSTIKQKGKGTRKQSENNFPIVIYRRWFMCEMIIVENCYNCQMLWVTLSH